MATWAGNSVWVGPDGAVVAYRVRGGVAITVGDPICTDRAATIRAFSDFCEQRGWMPVFYSVHAETAADLAGAGWSAMPVGTEAVLTTAGFSLSGKRRQDLRTAVNRAARESVDAVWTRYVDLDGAARAQVDLICGRWARTKRFRKWASRSGSCRTEGRRGAPDARHRRRRPRPRCHELASPSPRGRRRGMDAGCHAPRRRGHAGSDGVRDRVDHPAGGGRRHPDDQPVRYAARSARGRRARRLSRRVVRALEPAYGFSSLERFKAKFGAEHRPLWMCYPEGLQLGRIGSALVRAYVPGLRLRGIVATLKAMA
jgi:lysylphosphatidylglycerol synthetase-like protein (DUF2156 family)